MNWSEVAAVIAARMKGRRDPQHSRLDRILTGEPGLKWTALRIEGQRSGVGQQPVFDSDAFLANCHVLAGHGDHRLHQRRRAVWASEAVTLTPISTARANVHRVRRWTEGHEPRVRIMRDPVQPQWKGAGHVDADAVS